MLYAEKAEQEQNFLLGTWANGYFFSPGVTTAYTYSMNEDLYTTLWQDQTVLTKLPVRLLNSLASDNSNVEPTTVEPVVDETVAPEIETEPPADAPMEETQESVQGEVQGESQENAAEMTDTVVGEENQPPEEVITEAVTEEPTTAPEEPATEAVTEPDTTVKSINLTMLTPRDGLPDTAASLTGMRGDPAAPYVERTERSDRVNKFQASVFSNGGVIALIIGGVVIAAAIVVVLIRTKLTKNTESGQTNKPDNKKSKKSNKSTKSSKSKKSKKSR